MTSFKELFYSSNVLDPDVTDWDVSKVYNFLNTFRRVPRGLWNLNVTAWDINSEGSQRLLTFPLMFSSSQEVSPCVTYWNVSHQQMDPDESTYGLFLTVEDAQAQGQA